MKQTALDWFIEQLPVRILNQYQNEIIKAKALEKEQICNAYWTGVEGELYERTFRTSEQYYNETFKSE